MERGTSVRALQSMFHNSFSVCGADFFFPVFSEAGFLLGSLIKCPGDFFNDQVGAGARHSMSVNYEGDVPGLIISKLVHLYRPRADHGLKSRGGPTHHLAGVLLIN